MARKKAKSRKQEQPVGFGQRKTLMMPIQRPFQPVYRRTLVYADSRLLVGSTTPTAIQYRLTNLFDVDPLIGGHSPYGFNEIKALYSVYHVLSVSYRINIQNNYGTFGAVIAVAASVDNTLSSVATDYLSRADVECRFIGNQFSGHMMETFTGRVYPWTALGIPKRIYYDNVGYRGSSAAGPILDGGYLNVLCVDQMTNPANIQLNVIVQLCFETEFSQPVILAGT